jgi:hypothetical protein
MAAFSATCSVADEPAKAGANPDNELVGTWKLISAKYNGQENNLQGITMLKHVTPVQFMWAIYDKDGKVLSALGGSYTLKGDKYDETPEYGLADNQESLNDLKGKIQSFTWKIKGNKWYHDGKLSSGVSIEEVWERVEKK